MDAALKWPRKNSSLAINKLRALTSDWMRQSLADIRQKQIFVGLLTVPMLRLHGAWRCSRLGLCLLRFVNFANRVQSRR
jgi:hypothetical protein